ncbi:hypothetical protein HR51_39725 [Burkholderia cepacia]|nr:hypothetical protein HR51_39725 [Burkholderia cepacia]
MGCCLERIFKILKMLLIKRLLREEEGTVSKIMYHFIGLLATRSMVACKRIARASSLLLLLFTAIWRKAKTGRSSRDILLQMQRRNCWIIRLDLTQLTGK